jgi:hypothetical protein
MVLIIAAESRMVIFRHDSEWSSGPWPYPRSRPWRFPYMDPDADEASAYDERSSRGRRARMDGHEILEKRISHSPVEKVSFNLSL